MRHIKLVASKLVHGIALAALSFSVIPTMADLVVMDEFEMGNATGEGLGFALEDFVLSTDGASLKVTGIEDSAGNEIDINWTSLYIGGEVTEAERAAGITRSANVGSYLNPWTIQSVRGSMDAATNSPNYNDAYGRVGNDIALLELSTDSYSNNLQNSVTFGEYAYYENVASGTASQNIANEISGLNSESTAVINRYTSINATFNQLQSSIQISYQDSIRPQEIVVEADQSVYDSAKAVEEPFYQSMADNFQNALNAGMVIDDATDCVLGSQCTESSFWTGDSSTCGTTACEIARDTYNNSVDTWTPVASDSRDALAALTGSRQVLQDRLNATGSDDVYQYSYLDRMADRDKFIELCGFGRFFSDCTSGLISRKNDSKSSIDDITLRLSTGEARRRGFDIGSTFEFTLNSTGANGVVTSRDDYIDVKLKGMFIDGTSFRFWSRESDDLANPGAELNGELRLNLFARQISINACGDLCLLDPNVDGVFDPVKIANTTLNLDNFLISLNLGFGEIQPMKFSATSDGNFVFELTPPNPNAVGVDVNDTAAMQNFYDDYYANAPKSFVYVGDVNIGGNSIGSTTIDGFRAQYLKVQSRDL
jgi:hypothetical protein